MIPDELKFQDCTFEECLKKANWHVGEGRYFCNKHMTMILRKGLKK